MPRTSSVYYINPSAISITPNANGSANDFAVHVARGAKIKVYFPPIAELGTVDAVFQEWTLAGRNRRLTDASKPHTLYARLNKTDHSDAYLVFAPQALVEGEWTDPYILSPNTSSAVSMNRTGANGKEYTWEPIPQKQTQDGRSDYWWVKLGVISEPSEGQRTIDLDTGILGTDQYNSEWELDPDALPMSMYLTDHTGARIDSTLAVKRGSVSEVLIPVITRGFNDVSAQAAEWSWDIIEANGNVVGNTANTRQVRVVDILPEDSGESEGLVMLPDSWWQRGIAGLRCKAVIGDTTMSVTVRIINTDISSYEVSFSGYVDVITVDDVGNCIGGLYTQSPGGSSYRSYRIHSAITVRKNGVPLLYMPPSEGSSSSSSSSSDGIDDEPTPAGYYKIYAEPRGCKCFIEDSTLYISAIDNIKDGVAGTEDDTEFDYDAMRLMESCSVDLIIDCESVGAIQKSFPITIKHSSEPFVDARLTNQSSGISWNTKNAGYIGLPVVFDVQMWHNNEWLNVNGVGLTDSNVQVISNGFNGTSVATPDPEKIQCTIAPRNVTEGGVTHTEARVTIVSVPKDLPMVTTLQVSCSATYAGTDYERTLTHVINKSTDTNVYSVLPSPTSIRTANNNGTLQPSAGSVVCRVTCDSSDDKHYDLILTNGVNVAHRIVLTYQVVMSNSESTSSVDETVGAETLYTGAVPVSASTRRIKFTAYTVDDPTLTGISNLLDPSNNPHVEDAQDVQNIFDGTEGSDGIVADLSNQHATLVWSTRREAWRNLNAIETKATVWRANDRMNITSASLGIGGVNAGATLDAETATIYTFSWQGGKATFNKTTGVLKLTELSATFVPSTIQITLGVVTEYGTKTYNRELLFTVDVQRDGYSYELSPSVNDVHGVYVNNRYVYRPAEVSCGVEISDDDGTDVITSMDDMREKGVSVGYVIVHTDDTETTHLPSTLSSTAVEIADSIKSITFVLYKYASGTYVATNETETIHVVRDGMPGGEGPGITNTEDFYAVSALKDVVPAGYPASQSYNDEAAFVAALNNPTGSWAKTGVSTNSATPWLWNFEKHTMSDGSIKLTPPHRIGSFAKGIRSIQEFYALSANEVQDDALRSILNPYDWEVDYRDYLYESLWGGQASAFSPKSWWYGSSMLAVTEELSLEDPEDDSSLAYDGIEDVGDAVNAYVSRSVPTYYRADADISRAPTAALPYQWNWEHIVYTDGTTEDFYHISARIGAAGAEGPKGDTPIACYRWYKDGLTPVKPTDVTSDEPGAASGDHTGDGKVYPASKWLSAAPNRPAEGWKLWMCQSVKHTSSNGTVTRDTWNEPVCISGDKGAPGDDGDFSEWIFKYDDSGYDGLTGEVNPQSAANGSETNKNQKGWVPNGWNDLALPISENHVTLYASWRDYDGAAKTWGAFQPPIVWSHWGENGVDGAGIEHVFVRTKINTPPVVAPYYDEITAPDGQYLDSQSREPEDDDYLPVVRLSSGNIKGTGARFDQDWGNDCDECTDEPVGPTPEWPYEWVLTRRAALSANGRRRIFERYAGPMALWARWSKDGVSPTFTYTEEAWSPDDTMSDASKGPRTASYIADNSKGLPVNEDWSASTPPNPHNYAFLWRRSRVKVFNAESGEYGFASGSTWAYIRLNGTNGTSIHVKGSVIAIIPANGTAPTGASEGELYIKQGDATPYRYNGTIWSQTGVTAATDGDCFVIERTCDYDADGDGETEDVEGHMFMWSDEADNGNGAWVPLGPFKGEPGTTYYTHIAWAKSVTIGTPAVTVPAGQTTTPNATAVTDFSISPGDDYGWMGVLVNTDGSQDPAGNNKLLYTWSKVQGATGSSPWIADLDNQMDSVICDADGHPTQQQTVGTNVQLWYGSEAKAFYAKIYVGETNNEVSSSSASDVYVNHNNKDAASAGTSDTIALAFKPAATLQPKQSYRIILTAAEDENITRRLWFYVNGTMGNAVYNLRPSLRVISTQRIQGGYDPDKFSISCGYVKTNGNSDPVAVADALTMIDDKYYIYFRLRAREGAVWGNWTRYTSTSKNASLTNVPIATYDKVEFAIYKHTAGDSDTLASLAAANIFDRETIPVIEGGMDGAGSIKVNLDNGSEVMLYDNEGNRVSGAATALATLYDGVNDRSNDAAWSISDSDGVSLIGNGAAVDSQYSGAYDCWINTLRLLTVNGISKSDAYVKVRAEYPAGSGHYYYDRMTLHKQVGGVKYDLRNITPNVISYDAAKQAPETTSISVTVMRTPVSTGIAVPSDLPAGYSLMFCVPSGNSYVVATGYNGQSGKFDTLNSGNATFVNVNADKTEIRVVIAKLNGTVVDESTVLDSETIPVVSASKGAKGDDVKVVFRPSEIRLDADENDIVATGTNKLFTVELTVNGVRTAITDITDITGNIKVSKTSNGTSIASLSPIGDSSSFSDGNKTATLYAIYDGTWGDSIVMTVTGGSYTAVGVLTVSKNRKGNTGPEGDKTATVVLAPSTIIFSGDANASTTAGAVIEATGELRLPDGTALTLTGAQLVASTASNVTLRGRKADANEMSNTDTSVGGSLVVVSDAKSVKLYLMASGGRASGSMSIQLTGTQGTKTYSAIGVLTIQTLQRGALTTLYSLVCSPSSIAFRRTPVGEHIGEHTVSCTVMKSEGGGPSSQVNPLPSGMGLRCRKITDSTALAWESVNPYTVRATDANNGVTGLQFVFCTLSNGDVDTILAEATVPVVSEGASKIFYPMGMYDPATIYELTNFRVPMVYYNNHYWYLKQSMLAAGNTPAEGSAYWEMAAEYGVVITEGLFVQYAKLGSAIIFEDWLYSCNGRVGTAAAESEDIKSPATVKRNVAYGSGAGEVREENIIAYTMFEPKFPLGTEEYNIGLTKQTVTKRTSSGYESVSNTFRIIAGVTYKFRLTVRVNEDYRMFMCVFKNGVYRRSLGNTASTDFETKEIEITLSETADVTVAMAVNHVGDVEPYPFEGEGEVAMISYSVVSTFCPNYAVNLLTGRMIAARGNFVVNPNGSVVMKNTLFADGLSANTLDTQEQNGRRIHIEGGRLDVYNDVGTVGLRIGWDDDGDPFLMIAKVGSDGVASKSYMLTYDGVKEASATATADKCTSQVFNKAGGSAQKIHDNTGAQTYYKYSAARNLVTGEYTNGNPGQGTEVGTNWQANRARQDGKWFETNVVKNIIGSSGDSYRVEDGFYIGSHDETKMVGVTTVYSRELFLAQGGDLTMEGTVYYILTNDSQGRWCDEDGGNPSKVFDVKRYHKPGL